MNNHDHIISQKAKHQLELEMGPSAKDINVSTHSGSLQLSGIVDVLAEKKQAEDISLKINGVKIIKNNITISTDGTISDKEIEGKINKKLRTNINNSLVGVSARVDGGVAVLKGSVETQSDRRSALEEASKALGVKDVVNNMDLKLQNDDIAIQNELNRLFVTSYIDNQDVKPYIDEGTITLYGYVNNDEEAQNLKAIAEEIPGVKKVINKLKNRHWSLE